MNVYAQRLKELRTIMWENDVDVYLINGADPHMSEYAPDYWKTREFISGFTGSYGYLAISSDKAVMWTDSRYYLQAEEELARTGIEMIKDRLPDTISLEEWVFQNLSENGKVGFDGACFSITAVRNLKKRLKEKNARYVYREDFLDEFWHDRPDISSNNIISQNNTYTGFSRVEKFDLIRKKLRENNADIQIITALDDLAWTFNIRGRDVEYNPVVVGYGIVGLERQALFVKSGKIGPRLSTILRDDDVEIYNYNDIFNYLGEFDNKTIYVDPDRTNYLLKKTIPNGCKVKSGISIPTLLKAQKNSGEIEGMKKAMQSDGVALLNFHKWFIDTLDQRKISEHEIAMKLNNCRSDLEGYVGPSFFPIVGYKDHGSIIHFHVTPEVANVVEKDGILLMDSGAQYDYGTTDITRTFALNEPTNQMKKDFTLVLKGMIALTNAVFPLGTKGCHLDILARNEMLQNRLNYGHGTGHGVGACLNVHEGPQSIRQDLNSVDILPGMIMSNEPGLYRVGEYGIRIENVILCKELESNEFGSFLGFETLTLYPIETQLMDLQLLTEKEIAWINDYHSEVFRQLSPLVEGGILDLLKKLTAPIG